MFWLNNISFLFFFCLVCQLFIMVFIFHTSTIVHTRLRIPAETYQGRKNLDSSYLSSIRLCPDSSCFTAVDIDFLTGQLLLLVETILMVVVFSARLISQQLCRLRTRALIGIVQQASLFWRYYRVKGTVRRVGRQLNHSLS